MQLDERMFAYESAAGKTDCIEATLLRPTAYRLPPTAYRLPPTTYRLPFVLPWLQRFDQAVQHASDLFDS
jgi:hypothetical protein